MDSDDRWKQILAWISDLDIPKEHREEVARKAAHHWDALRWEVFEEQERRLREAVESGTISEEADVLYADDLRRILAEYKPGDVPFHAAQIDFDAVETEAGPVFWQDQIGARHLEDNFGAKGAEGAEKIRQRSVKRHKAFLESDDTNRNERLADLVELWGPPRHLRLSDKPAFQRTPRMPRFLALAIWHDEIKTQVERAQRLGIPGLPHGVLAGFSIALARSSALWSNRNGNLDLVKGPHLAGKINPDSVEIMMRRRYPAGVSDSALRGLLDSRIKAMKSSTGQRLFRYLVHAAFMKVVQGGSTIGPVELEFVGGRQEIAKRIGLKGHSREIQQIGDALDAYSFCNPVIPGSHREGHDWLIQWSDIPSGPGRRQIVRVVLNRPLTPFYANTLRGSDSLITPVPSLSAAPKLVSRAADHGPQMLMHLNLFLYLTEHSTELYQRGNVQIRPKDWQRLAEEAEVPRVLLDQVRDAWVAPSGSGDLFPVLQRVDGSRTRYTLAEHLDKEDAFLKEQGERRVRASKSGQASVRARKNGTRRRKPRKP